MSEETPRKKPASPRPSASAKKVPSPKKSPAKPKAQGGFEDWDSLGWDDDFVITPEEIARMAALWDSGEDDRPAKERNNADGPLSRVSRFLRGRSR